MKRMLIFALLLAMIAAGLTGCAPKKKALEESIQEQLDNVDQDHVDSLAYWMAYNEGNTYCISCKATNKGKNVKICNFCGQRIKKPKRIN